ncbi:unnamed protein product [Calicophoron daubneyi]|uniref:Protein kinase domain-containing protein n=1 Tax=Calicophoron daubneyi TaxID=300641 RepID=A0AAV2TB64_CALDB
MTATECLQHPWLKKKTILKRKGTVSKKRLKHFVYRRKWQKAVNAIIALLRMGVVLHHSPELEPKNASHGVKAPLTNMVNSAQKNTVKEPPAKITKIDKPPPLQEKNQRKVSFESGNPSFTVQSPSRKSSTTTEAATPPPNKAKRSKSKAISLLRRLSGKVDVRPSKEKYQPSEDSIQELRHLDESCPGKTTPVDLPKSKQKTESNPTSSSPLRFLNLSKKSTITRKTSKQSDTSISTASPPSSVENSNPESPLSPANSSLVKNKSTSSADTTVGMPTEGSKPSSKPGLHFGPKSSGEPSQSKPLSKMRAPVTGGIAAKIGFFANLTRNEPHK